MKKTHLFVLFLTITSVFQVQSATLVTLTAKQATGGALMKTNLNDSAVYFPAVNPANDRIVWTVPGTLPAGLYQLDIDIYQAAGISFSVYEYLSFEATGATQLSFLDFHDLNVTTGTYTKSVGFYSPNALSSIALIKSSQQNLPTFGIRAIRISTGTEAGMESIPFTFQLPVAGTKVTAPISLPAGAYQVKSTVATATTWTTGGGVVTAPSSNFNRIYIEKDAQPAILSGGPVSNIVITYLPTATAPNMYTAGVAPLMTIADSTKIETRTLKLIGYKGSGVPQLDVFPGGKKIAIVSSWDDGYLSDLQVVDTLLQYGMKSSFMLIPSISINMIPQMNVVESKGMEIGSHSWSHPPFYSCSPKRCMDEAVEARRFLESKLGHPVISFAYPYDYKPSYDVNGDYVLKAIRSAGYWFGRSTSTGSTLGTVDVMTEPLAMKPTSHFNVSAATIKSLLDAKLLIPGSVFHLWGHSNELATNMAAFRSTLAVLANNPSAWYATLGELMLWKYTRKQLIIEANLAATGDKTFTLKMPWLHPSLRKVPVSITVPTGVSAVEWQGVQYPVVNSRVQLMWGLPTQTNVDKSVTNGTFQISTNRNQLEVKNFTDGQEVAVYTLAGKEVARKIAVNSSPISFELASGVYLVRVGNESRKVVVF